MRLTVLGGSGGYPGQGRPCSGYLIDEDGFTILVDPGYGVATVLSAEGARGFDAVLVSHAHPDHCADLNPILRARAWSDGSLLPLPIYALSGALDAVMALDRPEVLAGSYVLADLEGDRELAIGPFRVGTARLPHPRPNLGFRLSVDGRSIAYTGDCGPSEDLIRLAGGTNLLLAEASYADAVPREVVGALSSAADVGAEARAAGAGHLVLTHLMPGTDEAASLRAARRVFSEPIDVARPGLVVEL